MPNNRVFVLRHGETEWSSNGRHTSVTDIELTPNGRAVAARLKPALETETFELVLCSPLRRARETCKLAGLRGQAELTDDLLEWNYGDYEGKTTPEIHEFHRDWTVFTQPCPNGETPDQITTRVDRVIARCRACKGDVALFAHGHILRSLAARWLGLKVQGGALLTLGTGAISILGYEHAKTSVILRWNAPI